MTTAIDQDRPMAVLFGVLPGTVTAQELPARATASRGSGDGLTVCMPGRDRQGRANEAVAETPLSKTSASVLARPKSRNRR